MSITAFKILLLVTPIFASPVEHNENSKPPMVTQAPELVRRQGASTWAHNSAQCSTLARDDRYAGLFSLHEHPEQLSFDYEGFCSEYLQSTVQVWGATTTTLSLTSTSISMSTVSTVSTTTTDTRPTTTTALCPKPSKSMTCGKEGLGYQMYQLGQLEPEVSSPENCHQLCLQNPACKSYQIPRGRWTNCFTFNVTAGPEGNYVNATQLTGFGSPPPFPLTYDRGCPDHLLPACGPKPLEISAAPTITTIPAIAQRDYRTIVLPPVLSTYLAQGWPFYLACPCWITQAAAPATITRTPAVIGTWPTITTTITTTHVVSFTESPGLKTVYSTID
ncbi:hypothetical protein B0J14DRAFT_707657 [Halenospora varia]|nr:hypothetical protein B0J14DRAFT_707657 [Halenospora varia]